MPESNVEGLIRRIIPIKVADAVEVVVMLTQHDEKNRETVKKYHWCEAIPVDRENWYDLWPSCNPNADLCDGGNN